MTWLVLGPTSKADCHCSDDLVLRLLHAQPQRAVLDEDGRFGGIGQVGVAGGDPMDGLPEDGLGQPFGSYGGLERTGGPAGF